MRVVCGEEVVCMHSSNMATVSILTVEIKARSVTYIYIRSVI
jgi:hypothetical protein